VLPGLSSALPGALRLVVSAQGLVAGAPRCFQGHLKFSPALWGVPKPITIAAGAVINYPSYSEGRPECPPRVWYSAEIDASKFTLHVLSDTPGVFQWLKYILLMWISSISLRSQFLLLQLFFDPFCTLYPPLSALHSTGWELFNSHRCFNNAFQTPYPLHFGTPLLG